MSFILEDKHLLQQLLNSIQKEAQATPAVSVVPTALKLVNRLQRQYAGTAEPLNISSAQPTDLVSGNLQNLGTLLKYLRENQISINGTRVVFDKAEYDAMSKDQRNQLSPVTINVGRVSGGTEDRKFLTADYYTNLPLLVDYVQHLQDTAKKMGPVNGKVLDVYVGKLIDQVKAIKPDASLSRVPKSEPGQPREIPDGITLDMFNTKTLDPSNPMSDRGTKYVLKSEDLKTWQSLNAWLQNDMASVVTHDANNKVITKKYNDPTTNKCDVINALYNRARYWSGLAKTEEESKRYSYYVKKLQELGPSFQAPDGSACTINGGTSSSHETPGTNTSGNGQNGLPNDGGSQALGNMVNSLPLAVEDIDFHRILSFINQYKLILDNSQNQSRKTEVMTSIGLATQHMIEATKLTLQAKQSFSMSADPSEVASWLKPPPGDKYLALLYHLRMVLQATSSIVGNFYAAYVRKASPQDKEIFDSEQRAMVAAQIVGGGSIFQDNWNNVRALEARVNEVVSFKK